MLTIFTCYRERKKSKHSLQDITYSTLPKDANLASWNKFYTKETNPPPPPPPPAPEKREGTLRQCF